MASDIRPPVEKNGKVREKVSLKPGFHLADWMRLTSVINKKGDGLKKISLTELGKHKSEFDCWTAYNGKVYDITQYIAYHPGGKPKLMLGAGKDCTELFDRYHRWVNIGSILGKCVVGVLCQEEEAIAEGKEDEEDDDDVKADKDGSLNAKMERIEESICAIDLLEAKDDDIDEHGFNGKK